jgi:hypothetical protein
MSSLPSGERRPPIDTGGAAASSRTAARVDDLPIADLDHDGIDKQHRVDPAVSIGGRELAGVGGGE